MLDNSVVDLKADAVLVEIGVIARDAAHPASNMQSYAKTHDPAVCDIEIREPAQCRVNPNPIPSPQSDKALERDESDAVERAYKELSLGHGAVVVASKGSPIGVLTKMDIISYLSVNQ